MAMLKIGEIRAMTEDELLGRIEEGHQELFNLRFQRATGNLTNPMRFRHVPVDTDAVPLYAAWQERQGTK